MQLLNMLDAGQPAGQTGEPGDGREVGQEPELLPQPQTPLARRRPQRRPHTGYMIDPSGQGQVAQLRGHAAPQADLEILRPAQPAPERIVDEGAGQHLHHGVEFGAGAMRLQKNRG